MDDAQRLARFEALLAAILAEQGEIAAALADLKARGQVKSCRFKELLAARHQNEALLARFRGQGLL